MSTLGILLLCNTPLVTVTLAFDKCLSLTYSYFSKITEVILKYGFITVHFLVILKFSKEQSIIH